MPRCEVLWIALATLTSLFLRCYVVLFALASTGRHLAANMLQCELFPGDFKKVLEMLVHVAVVWSRNKRLADMPLENAGEAQLAHLLDLFFRCAQLRRVDWAPYRSMPCARLLARRQCRDCAHKCCAREHVQMRYWVTQCLHRERVARAHTGNSGALLGSVW
jgi:hypothetical protein